MCSPPRAAVPALSHFSAGRLWALRRRHSPFPWSLLVPTVPACSGSPSALSLSRVAAPQPRQGTAVCFLAPYPSSVPSGTRKWRPAEQYFLSGFLCPARFLYVACVSALFPLVTLVQLRVFQRHLVNSFHWRRNRPAPPGAQAPPLPTPVPG